MCFAPCSHLFSLFLLFPLFLLSVSSSKPNLWAQHRGPRGHVKKRFSQSVCPLPITHGVPCLGAVPSITAGRASSAAHFPRHCEAQGRLSWRGLSSLLEQARGRSMWGGNTAALEHFCPLCGGSTWGEGRHRKGVSGREYERIGGTEESYEWKRKAFYMCINVI